MAVKLFFNKVIQLYQHFNTGSTLSNISGPVLTLTQYLNILITKTWQSWWPRYRPSPMHSKALSQWCITVFPLEVGGLPLSHCQCILWQTNQGNEVCTFPIGFWHYAKYLTTFSCNVNPLLLKFPGVFKGALHLLTLLFWGGGLAPAELLAEAKSELAWQVHTSQTLPTAASSYSNLQVEFSYYSCMRFRRKLWLGQ